MTPKPRGPFRLLVAHFWGRFFRSERASAEGVAREHLGAILATCTVAIPTPFAALFTLHVLMGGLPDTLWPFGAYYFGLVLAGASALAVAAWNDIFPDEVDQEVLVTLPVRRVTVMGAKAIAVAFLMGMGAMALNALTPLVFASFIEWPGHGGPRGTQVAGAYLASGLMASLFAFSLCGVLRGATLLLPDWRSVRRASNVIQSAVAFSLVGGLAILPFIFQRLSTMHDSGPGILALAPPAWFVGLAQALAGDSWPPLQLLAKVAIWATSITVILFTILFPIGFRRFFLLCAERGQSPIGRRRRRWASGVVNGLILRHPQARAVFWFFLYSMFRGSRQQMRLLSHLAVGAGWIFIVQAASGWGAQLAAPMIGFLAVAGTRSACRTVLQERAAWIARVTENDIKWGYTSGLRWGIRLGVLTPVFLTLAAWMGLTGAVSHPAGNLFVNFLAACLLAETILAGRPRFAFTLRPSPGRIAEPVALVLGFLGYIALARFSEQYLSGLRFGYTIACAGLAAVLAAVAAIHRKLPPQPFVFQETENLLSSHIFGGAE